MVDGELGSKLGKGRQDGGYTYRLCKLPAEEKKGLTEECFVKNVLKFANKFTKIRSIIEPGNWTRFKLNDVHTLTYPQGSKLREIGQADPT